MWHRCIFYTIIVIFMAVCVEGAELRFYHGSLELYTATRLEDPLELLPFFNISRVSVFYVFGFNEDANSGSAIPILSAYLRNNNTNVILLNWEKEAKKYDFFSYRETAAPNAKKVGIQFGLSLVMLIESGISEDKIHLIGHSLGSQLTSFAGETVQLFNYNLSRITGLDPAGPDFEGPFGMKGLNASRAKFVDVLHTNPGEYGIFSRAGTVDFWANCGGFTQPGCYFVPIEEGPVDCSHIRSYKLFAEAIVSPTAFPAASESNCERWKERDGKTSEVIYLGDLVDRNARGNFYFSTKAHYPFAKGEGGLKPSGLL